VNAQFTQRASKATKFGVPEKDARSRNASGMLSQLSSHKRISSMLPTTKQLGRIDLAGSALLEINQQIQTTKHKASTKDKQASSEFKILESASALSHRNIEKNSSPRRSAEKTKNVPTPMRGHQLNREAPSSMFRSGVERLPEITGRHSSMTMNCPGPGDYNQVSHSIDFTLRQHQVNLSGRKRTPPFIYGRRTVKKKGKNIDRDKLDQVLLKDKANRV